MKIDEEYCRTRKTIGNSNSRNFTAKREINQIVLSGISIYNKHPRRKKQNDNPGSLRFNNNNVTSDPIQSNTVQFNSNLLPTALP